MAGTILSVLMLAGLALGAGGLFLIAKRRDYRRGWLMIVAAMVMFVNVAIWVTPTGSGKRLATEGQP
jgi:uncharacterized membrane protein